MKKISLIKSKKNVIYSKKDLILMKMIKIHLNYIIKSEIIVSDTGKSIGAAHNICNLRYKTP